MSTIAGNSLFRNGRQIKINCVFPLTCVLHLFFILHVKWWWSFPSLSITKDLGDQEKQQEVVWNTVAASRWYANGRLVCSLFFVQVWNQHGSSSILLCVCKSQISINSRCVSSFIGSDLFVWPHATETQFA